mgnify:CR=1 FL=1
MMEHYSVLLQECLEGLHIREDGIYVDATLGRGGHSAEILKRCPKGHLYAFDRDAQAIAQSLPRQGRSLPASIPVSPPCRKSWRNMG